MQILINKAEEDARKAFDSYWAETKKAKAYYKKTVMMIEKDEAYNPPYSCLKRHGINNLSELEAMTQEDLMKVRNLGRKSMEEIVDKIEHFTGNRIPFFRDES